jgi:DNA-binding MarR family transcriptional regulator
MEIKELASSLRAAISALHKGLRKQTNLANAFSMTEIETIAHLNRNRQLLPTALAKLTRVKTQSMSQILKKLENLGIIKRTASKEDKRNVYISITAAGKKEVEKNRYERDEWLKNAIESNLNEKEKTLLEKVLPVLNKLTSNNKF